MVKYLNHYSEASLICSIIERNHEPIFIGWPCLGFSAMCPTSNDITKNIHQFAKEAHFSNHISDVVKGVINFIKQQSHAFSETLVECLCDGAKTVLTISQKQVFTVDCVLETTNFFAQQSRHNTNSANLQNPHKVDTLCIVIEHFRNKKTGQYPHVKVYFASLNSSVTLKAG
jgi:hypothetical protein